VSFKFVCPVAIWNDILSETDIVSKMLLCPQSNINESVKVFYELVKFLNGPRSNEAFIKYISDAKTLAAEVNAKAEFPATRSRTKVRHFSYESADDSITDPAEMFQVECNLTIVDIALTAIQESFQTLAECNNLFRFLSEFSEMSEDEIKRACFHLNLALQVTKENTISKDTDGIDLMS
jgi:hypothetical protein